LAGFSGPRRPPGGKTAYPFGQGDPPMVQSLPSNRTRGALWQCGIRQPVPSPIRSRGCEQQAIHAKKSL